MTIMCDYAKLGKDLDYFNFGIKSDDGLLLQQICDALQEIHLLGDLSLRAEWIIYKGIPEASLRRRMSVSNFRNRVKPKPDPYLLSIERFNYPNSDFLRTRHNLNLGVGATVVLEMPAEERHLLFRKRIGTSDRDKFLRLIEKRLKEPRESLIAKCIGFLEHCLYAWQFRRNIRIFFTKGFLVTEIRDLQNSKAELEEKSRESRICSLVAEILRRYETFSNRNHEMQLFKKQQQRILARSRKQLFELIARLDGKYCSICRESATDKFHLDHIRPCSLGGLTILNNLRILCPKCNRNRRERHILTNKVEFDCYLEKMYDALGELELKRPKESLTQL